MDKRFLIVLAALVIIFGGIFAFSQRSSDKSSGSTLGSQVQLTNHVLGQGGESVTLLEYGDFQCPVCSVFYLPIKQVTEQLSADIYFQFRNLPLVQIHQNAYSSARAAEAAALQGKFWEMHDKLYENQDPTGQSGWVASSSPINFYSTFAQQIGLNVEQFKQDFASSKVNDLINADLAEFKKTGKPQSTPSLFLDGQLLDNNSLFDQNTRLPSVDKLTKIIQDAIAKKSGAKQ